MIVNTRELLDKIHNTHNKDDKGETTSLRHAIRRRATELIWAMRDYFRAKDRNNDIEMQRAEQKIKDIVSRSAPYTMLMRSLAKDDFDNLFD